jgi:hypothetical protein
MQYTTAQMRRAGPIGCAEVNGVSNMPVGMPRVRKSADGGSRK